MNEYGLIGYPLSHSFSQEYFTKKFQSEGLNDCRFELFPLEFIGDFAVVLRDHPSLKGIAVTIPYKEQVMRYLTSADRVAEAVGAVNCIKISGSFLTGYNTDVMGFERSFVPQLQNHHKKALILGTGGAAKAVQYVLKKLGMRFLLVTRKETTGPGYIGYDEINAQLLQEYPVIINCTPLGMWPNENTRPELPYHCLDARNYLYDLVYKPEETLFLKEGKKYGAIIKNGFEMLLVQAEENWRIWNE
jgi:shikimate dehydrogenase